MVGGYYGYRSHSGYAAKHRDLFLEERWEVARGSDGGAQLAPVPASLGVWLSAEDLVALERYPVDARQLEERGQQSDPRAHHEREDREAP